MKRLSLILALICFSSLFLAAYNAPETLTPGSVVSEYQYVQPFDAEKQKECLSSGGSTQKNTGFGMSKSVSSSEKKDADFCSSMYWMGTDRKGIPLIEYATQGAKIVLFPSLIAGLLTCLFGVFGGLLRCMELPFIDSVTQIFAEVVGALPRMVVILVCALILPRDIRGLLPLALVWAILSAPTAMDEAGAVTSRLGGARFVEALRAHGFSAFRIYLYHIVALNLRPVVVRQGAEVMMQVVFLEVALSYLAVLEAQSSFTHADSIHSWADLLKMGYSAVVVDVPSLHALILGLGLIAFIVVTATALTNMARAR
jgi:ABC-type dipeptide/oligopeptide/nickel transport system permease subunit